MKNLYSINKLTASQYKKLKRKKISVLRVLNPVSNAFKEQLKADGISLVIQSNFTEFMDLGYSNSSELVRSFAVKYQKLFNKFNVTIEPILVKYLLWSRLEKLRLTHVMDTYPTTEYNYFSYLNSIKSKLKARLKILHNLSKPNYLAQDARINKYVQGKIIVRVQSAFQITLIEKILKKLPENSFTFLTFSEVLDVPEAYKDVPVIKFSKDKNNYCNIGFISLIKLAISQNSDESSDVIVAINSAYYYHQVYEGICKGKPKSFFFLAGENDSSVLMACKVAKKNEVKTYNYMNGIKGNTPSNLDTEFYKWFMHDDFTKDMLLQYDKNLTSEGCPVVGHLESDNFHEDLKNPDYNEYLNPKSKVITVFGSPIYFKEKQAVLKSMTTYLDASSYIIYYKPHPNENIEVNLPSNFKLITTKDKETNRKLIVASTLIISFASTLALEASFINSNVWNVEFKQVSISPSIENNITITSLKSESEVNSFVKQIHKIRYLNKMDSTKKVASLLVQHL